MVDNKSSLSPEKFLLAHVGILEKNYESVVDALEDVENSVESFLKSIYGPNFPKEAMPSIDKSVSIPQRFKKVTQILKLLEDISIIPSSNNERSKVDERN